MRVSVIGTIHEPSGRATPEALLAILRTLQPEVIFLEMPPGALDDYMDGLRSNLESAAVRQYRLERKVELVAVDMPTPAPEFFAGIDAVGREVRAKSVEYCRLKSWELQYLEQHGFDFLNSAHGAQIATDIHVAIQASLTELADARLSAHYDVFTSTNERRDSVMLGNIETFCASAPQAVGVFLVGSAHRRSLYEKSSERSGASPYPVVWEFPGFG